MREVSYRPLHTDHPASANDLAIFADGPHRFHRKLETDFEAIGDLRVWIRVRCLAELLEIFDCDAVFIWRISKNDNVEWFSSLVWSSLGCSRHLRIKVRGLRKFVRQGLQEMGRVAPTERWRYDGLSVYVAFKISLTEAVGGASSSNV
jgi:hypothetical protein